MTSCEWDEVKRITNLRKHGVDFADAPLVFDGTEVTRADVRFPYGEPRFITFGMLRGRVVVIAHTERDGTTRIVSMRYANAREKARFFHHRRA